MALRIRKEYKQPDGTMIEVEGTEAEIEAYERKQQKKNESAQRKKEILHGKSRKLSNADVVEELKRYLSEEMRKLQAIRETHHWYYNNGWWWRPWWVGGNLTYIYSQTQPVSGYNGPVDSFYTTTNVSEISGKIGLSENVISSKPTTASIATGVWNASNSIASIASTNGIYTVNGTACNTTGHITADSIQTSDYSTMIDNLVSSAVN